MKMLSEQISALSDRTHKTADTVEAVRANNLTRLDAQRDSLQAAVDAAKASAKERAATSKSKADGAWASTRASLDQQFDALRDNAEIRRADHDVNKAEHHADIAERDASRERQWLLPLRPIRVHEFRAGCLRAPQPTTRLGRSRPPVAFLVQSRQLCRTSLRSGEYDRST